MDGGRYPPGAGGGSSGRRRGARPARQWRGAPAEASDDARFNACAAAYIRNAEQFAECHYLTMKVLLRRLSIRQSHDEMVIESRIRIIRSRLLLSKLAAIGR